MGIINTPERSKKRRKKNGLLLKFGINYDQYEAIKSDQNGVCCICQQVDHCGRDLAVDHNHVSGKIRGLLCTDCNTALGLFKDDISLLQGAINYLSREYVVPEVECSLGKIDRDDAKGWKMLVTTPDGKFPSLEHAAKFYGVYHTTIRSWCLENSKYKKDGFSCEKLFLSLNEMKELIDVRN